MNIGDTRFENPEAVRLVELMRKRLANEFGVTVIGPNVCVRFYESDKADAPLIQIGLKIVEVDDGNHDEDYDEE